MDSGLMDKLRLLGLDTTLRPQIKMKRMSRVYFSVASNPAEQQFAFVSVAVWLARKAHAELEMPREEDDPNSTIAGIVEVLQSRGVTVDFSAHKLKQGYGEQVLFVLNRLADDAMAAEGFRWEKPVLTQPDDEDPVDDADQIEDETEIMLDKADDEMEIYSEDSEDDAYLTSSPDVAATTAVVPPLDLEQWRLELERVTPALRVKISGDGLDWRARHAQINTLRDELAERYKATGPQLLKLHGSIGSCLDKMATREKILNEQFSPIIGEYARLLEEFEKVTAESQDMNAVIAERQELLNELNAKVEAVKAKTESKGSSMNDNSPLVNAKKAVAALKKEIQDLDFQIVVLMWLLTTKDSPGFGVGGLNQLTTAETY